MRTAVAICVTVVLAGAEARAETVDDLLRQALAKRDQGAAEKNDRAKRREQLEEALSMFERAHELEKSGRTVGLLGICDALLEKWEASEEHLLAALADESDRWVAKNRPLLKRWLGDVQGHFGHLVVSGTPAGAAVWLNGKMRGTLPLPGPIRTGEGQAQLQVNAPGGYQPRLESVTVRAGQQVAVAVALEKPRMVELTPRPEHSGESGMGDPGRGGKTTDKGPTDTGARWSNRKIAGAVMGGVGLLAVGVGTALTVQAGNRCDEDKTRGLGCLDRGAQQRPGLITAGAGAAVAVGGLALWLVSKDVSVSVGRSSAAVSVRGAF